MSSQHLFMDTAFIQASLAQNDQYYAKTQKLLPLLRTAEVWVTEAVLTEVGNALSKSNRNAATQFIELCYDTPNIHVVTIDTPLFKKALKFYNARSDKNWGLTDCISFVVMEEQNLTEALTADKHFLQAGFRALLLEA